MLNAAIHPAVSECTRALPLRERHPKLETRRAHSEQMADGQFDDPPTTPQAASNGIELVGVETSDTAWKACAYGDCEKLRSFVASDLECVNKADEQVGPASVTRIGSSGFDGVCGAMSLRRVGPVQASRLFDGWLSFTGRKWRQCWTDRLLCHNMTVASASQSVMLMLG